ncbi:Protein THYLAKOID ASSEMBLY 8, chloroplastic [Linum perenne]
MISSPISSVFLHLLSDPKNQQSLSLSSALKLPDLPNLSRLLKPDLISVLHELLQRDLCHNALSIFSVLRSEFQNQKVDLNLYADPIFALLKNRMIDEIDNLLRELDAVAEEGKVDC